MVVDVLQHIENHIVDNAWLNRSGCSLHGLADHDHEVDDAPIIAELHHLVRHVLLRGDVYQQLFARQRIRLRQFIVEFSGLQAAVEVTLEVNLPEAKLSQRFRAQIQEAALVVLQRTAAHQPVHPKRRHDNQLIVLQRKHAAVHIVDLATLIVDVKFVEIVAMQPADGVVFRYGIARFVLRVFASHRVVAVDGLRKSHRFSSFLGSDALIIQQDSHIFKQDLH